MAMMEYIRHINFEVRTRDRRERGTEKVGIFDDRSARFQNWRSKQDWPYCDVCKSESNRYANKDRFKSLLLERNVDRLSFE